MRLIYPVLLMYFRELLALGSVCSKGGLDDCVAPSVACLHGMDALSKRINYLTSCDCIPASNKVCLLGKVLVTGHRTLMFPNPL